MGILNITKKKGIPVKKLTVCFTLTLLFAISISASSLTLYFGGKATIKYSNLPETFFYVSITGAKDSSNIKKSIAIKDTLNSNTNVIYSGNPWKKVYTVFVNASCSLNVIAKKKGFIFDTCESFSWSTEGWSIDDFTKYCVVYEKKPKIDSLKYYVDSLKWGIDTSTIVDSQFLLIRHKNSILDSLISLNSTQLSYQLTPSSNKNDTITVKLITLNADSSDTSVCYVPPMSTSIKNKITNNLIPQKTSSTIFNAQGQLIYRGIDSRFPKFSAGEYFTINKNQMLLR